LLLTLSAGHADVLEAMIALEADVNATNDLIDTPLHLAVSRSHEAAALLLLEHGADLNARNKDKRTPGDLARAGSLRDKLVPDVKSSVVFANEEDEDED